MPLHPKALWEMEEELGLFAALAESAFVRRDDGVVLYFPWGSSGRGYEIGSEREHRRLRRELAWISRFGFLGVPIAACFTLATFGLLPLFVLGPLLGTALLLRILWSTRRLLPCAERIGRDEARARLAAALSPRRIRRVTGFFLALGAVSLVLLFTGDDRAGALVACLAAGIGAASMHGILSSIARRYGPRSR